MISFDDMSDKDIRDYLAESYADDYLASMEAHEVQNI